MPRHELLELVLLLQLEAAGVQAHHERPFDELEDELRAVQLKLHGGEELFDAEHELIALALPQIQTEPPQLHVPEAKLPVEPRLTVPAATKDGLELGEATCLLHIGAHVRLLVLESKRGSRLQEHQHNGYLVFLRKQVKVVDLGLLLGLQRTLSRAFARLVKDHAVVLLLRLHLMLIVGNVFADKQL